MMSCSKCGGETRITFMVGVSAPSSIEGKFSKSALRRKDVHFTHANWETINSVCVDCTHSHFGYGNYVSRLESELKRLKEKYEPEKK